MFLHSAFLTLFCLCGWAQAPQEKPEGPRPPSSSASDKKFAPDRVLVRFRAGKNLPAQSRAHQRAHGRAIHRFQTIEQLEVVQLEAGTTVKDALKAYRADPNVLYAEPDYRGHAREVVPNDPYFFQLWGLKNTGASGGVVDADIDATDAWTLSTGSDTVVVGIIDSGMDVSHPDLAANVYSNAAECTPNGIDDDGNGYVDDCHGVNMLNGGAGPMWDDLGHGTHVSGTIGAVGNNTNGVAGVNWKIKLLPCRWLDGQGDGYVSDAIKCVEYMSVMKDKGVNIVATNNSWGLDGYSQGLYDAIKGEMDRGILFVAAAGNGGADGIGDNNDVVMDTPSGYPLANVIAVAATTRTDAKASFSNYGPHSVHLGAPGSAIYSTLPASSALGSQYGFLSGTSMAAPHVTGTIALLNAYNPTWTWTEVRNRVLAGGDVKSALASTITSRRLNAYGAMTCVNRNVKARVWPASSTVTVAVGEPVTFTVLSINCGAPSGPVSLTVNGQVVQLTDDGNGADQVANDGYFTGQWVPTQVGSYTATVTGETVTVIALKPYRYANGSEPYRSITGTNLALGDETSAAVTTPFPIHFGGQTFSKLYANSNGLITFDRAYDPYFPSAMPQLGANAIVAPLWDDLNPGVSATQNVFWQAIGTAPNRELVMEWRNVPHWPDTGTGVGVTFQVVFSESSDKVIFNYSDVVFGGTGGGDYGSSAGVGVQVSTAEGTQYSLDTPALQNGMSLVWTPSGPDFDILLDDSSTTVYPNVDATISGKLKGWFGYTTPVDLACGGSAPGKCTGSNVTPTNDGAPFTLTAADVTPGTYNFNVNGTASDGSGLAHSVPFTLKVVDFQLGATAPSATSAPDGGASGVVTVPVSAYGPFGAAVSLSCSGLPAGGSCTFAPSSTVNPTAGNPVNVQVTVLVASKTTPGDYPITISATSPGVPAARTQQFTLSVLAYPDFLLSMPSTAHSLVGQVIDVPVALDTQDNYAGTVQLGCVVSPPLVPCAMLPMTVNSYPAVALLRLDPSGLTAGSFVVTVTATDGTLTHSVTLSYEISGWVVTGPTTLNSYTGLSNGLQFTVSPTSTYYGTVQFSCDATAFSSTATCWVGDPIAYFKYYRGSTNTYLYFTVPNDVVDGTHPLVLRGTDSDTGASSDFVINVSVKGFKLTRGERFEHTIVAGDTSDPFDVVFTPYGGYDVPTFVNANCQTQTCTFNDYTAIPPDGPATRTFTVTAPLQENGTAGGTFSIIPRGFGQINQNQAAIAYGEPMILHVQDWMLETDLGTYQQVAVAPGGSTHFNVTNRQFNELNLPVDIVCDQLAAPELTCTLSKSHLDPNEAAVVTVTAGADALPSNRTFRLHGVAHHPERDLVHTQNVSLGVGNFSLKATPASITVPKGGSAQFFASLNYDFSNYPQPVVTCSGLDAGMSCDIPNGYYSPSFSVVVHTDSNLTTVGPHTFQVNAAFGSFVQSVPLTVTMQGDDGLILAYPNGGSACGGDGCVFGSQAFIGWRFVGNPGPTIKIELLNHGVPDQLIGSGVPLGNNGNGSYLWVLPSDLPYSNAWQIRITSETRPEITDTSDFTFRAGKGIEVFMPNGGERFLPGNAFISWISSTTTNVKIDLMKGGQLSANLSPSVPTYSPSASYWVVLPNVPGDDYQIRVTNNLDPTMSDTSDAPFSIVGTPSIHLVSPAGGERWLQGTTHTLSWTYSNIPDNADITLRVSGIAIASGMLIGSNGVGSIAWTIPPDFPSSGLTSASITVNPVQYNTTAYSPAFTIGDYHFLTATRTGSDVGYVQSNPSGIWISPWTNPSVSIPFQTGSSVSLSATSYNSSIFAGWSGDCNGTAGCTVVMDTDRSVTATFNSPLPSITVSSPNGSESWDVGSLQTIRWSYANNPGSSVKVELLKAGAVVSTISASTSIGSGGTGSLQWIVPTNLLTASTYTVRVTSNTNTTIVDTSDAPFTINGPGVTVTSPNGGENWQPGTVQAVKWTVRGSVGSLVRIELYKSGVLNRTLTTGVSATAGTFSWAVLSAQTVGSDYKIKITSTTNATYTDQSDANFSIMPLNLTVTAPNGGEVWRPGTQHAITWTSTGPVGTDLKIELLKGGVVDSVVVASVPIANGTYLWTVPDGQAHASTYTVRITSNQNTAVTDSSNAAFTIDDLYQLAVTKAGTGLGTVTSSPAGITCGATCAANFSSGAQVTLTATANAGHTFNGWAGACTADPCVITIDSDQSVTATFTAPPTGVTVTSPNGGESWTAGTLQTIRWSYSGSVGTTVRVDVYKAGVLNRTLTTAVSVGTGGVGQLSWTIPTTQAAGSDYTVKVTSSGGYSDTSDAAFRIVGPGITVTAPNGGESYMPGTTQTIRWTYTGSVGTLVRVDLYKSGVLNRTLTAGTSVGTGGNGSFNWVIASTQAVGSDYKVKVTSTTNATYTDQSNANFTVANTSVKVTSPNGGEVWRPGTGQTVNWTYSGSAGTDVKVELLKGGVSQTVMAAATPIGSNGAGSYSWTVPADVVHGGDYAVRVTSNQNVTLTDASDANFMIDELYQLSVTRQGTGSGTITSAPAGINCGATCAANFSSGAQVTLTAAPAAGHTFDGWSGACAGTGTCTVSMDGDQAVSATFTAPASGITVVSPNGGEIFVQGQSIPIKWSYTGAVGTALKIELLSNGVVARTISTAAAIGSNGTGAFTWKVSTSQTVSEHYRVRITSTTVPSATDTSDGDFSIDVM